MSPVLRFLTVLQKCLIAASILCFIPVSILVFLPHQHIHTTAQLALYAQAHAQVYTPFLVDVRSGCTFREAVLNNGECIVRAGVANGVGVGCEGLGYMYAGMTYCSGSAAMIMNQVVAGPGGLALGRSIATYPIFTLAPPLSAPTVTYYHYQATPSSTECNLYASALGANPQSQLHLLHAAYHSSATLLWYSLLPTLAALLAMVIINEVSHKFNLRKYIIMANLCIDVGYITLIIKGIVYYSDSNRISALYLLFSGCFVQEPSTNLVYMATVDVGVGFGYVFFMGVVLLLVVLGMVGHLVTRLVEWKYYREREGLTEGDMEMSEMRATLRSKQFRSKESAMSNRVKIVDEN